MAVAVSSMEWKIAERLQADHINYQTQVPLPITSCDFYFPTSPRPLVVFIDGPPHLEQNQMRKDDIYRTALRHSGYRVLELPYSNDSEKQCEQLYEQIRKELYRLGVGISEGSE
jgi:very-short-patch-repair endonuclease